MVASFNRGAFAISVLLALAVFVTQTLQAVLPREPDESMDEGNYAIANPIDKTGFNVHDPLIENAPELAIRLQPVLDYDKDSCYNVIAMDTRGVINPGLQKNSHMTDGCRHYDILLGNQNVYVRSRCNNGWCAYMYEHYFEKDITMDHPPWFNIRHEWEHVIVMARKGSEVAEYVYPSQWGTFDRPDDQDDVRFEGTHPKVVYHKINFSSHGFRIANRDDDKIENHAGSWIRGALVDWDTGFPDMTDRDRMIEYFNGFQARPKLTDDLFEKHVGLAVEYDIPEFDPTVDERWYH